MGSNTSIPFYTARLIQPDCPFTSISKRLHVRSSRIVRSNVHPCTRSFRRLNILSHTPFHLSPNIARQLQITVPHEHINVLLAHGLTAHLQLGINSAWNVVDGFSKVDRTSASTPSKPQPICYILLRSTSSSARTTVLLSKAFNNNLS